MAQVTHKVVRGDTLWALSRKYGTTVDAIAKLNNIKNPNLIYVGQVLIISGKEASTTPSPSPSPSPSTPTPTPTPTPAPSAPTQASITHFGLQADTDRTVFAVWSWSRANTDKYTAKWWYDTGNGVWFVGSESDVKDAQSIYSAPSNAKRVKFQVKPISTTYKSNDNDVHYWSANWSSSKEYSFAAEPPAIPPTPTVSIKDYTLTAKIENFTQGSEIQFQIIQNDSTVYKTGTASIITSSASYSCSIAVGNDYKVRCRNKDNGVYSDWSDYSSNVQTKPSAPTGITSCTATSETSVRLIWAASNSALTYDIQYVTNVNHFDGSNAITSLSGIEHTVYEVTGLTSGTTYFFRVRAVNDQGESSWTGAKSVTIGTKPEAPTTWSSTTTAIVNDTVVLHWVHNTEDGSKERGAQIEITVNGKTNTIDIPTSGNEEENRSYTLSTSSYSDGTKIEWRVRTKGAVEEWGDWSVKRSIDVFATPSLSLNMTDAAGDPITVLTSFPFFIKGSASPVTQTPIGYHVTIVANNSYECLDEIGNIKVVTKGQEVYSKFYDVSQELLLYLTPDSVDLQNNVSYTINCVVTMNTGLNAEESIDFEVYWYDAIYSPNADITYDPETLCTHIRPYCDQYPTIFYEVTYNRDRQTYSRTKTVLTDVSGTSVDEAFTEDYDDIVYSGMTGSGKEVYFCVTQSETPVLVEGITLSVYRREYDGRFVEIGTGLSNGDKTFVTDPHPALDYARYRIVAIADATGAVSYTDIPGHFVGEKSVIIQWDEVWDSFEATEESRMEKPAWSGSMLKLPYNIDVSDSNTIDVSMVEYIGRSHPVSYYGTQLGVTSTWNVEVLKNDKNTLYGLRKLAIYMGDVYVREPSGSGYWANVAVSFSQTHCEATIPVTLNITRVEGGI